MEPSIEKSTKKPAKAAKPKAAKEPKAKKEKAPKEPLVVFAFHILIALTAFDRFVLAVVALVSFALNG